MKFQFAVIAAIFGLISSGPTGAVIGFLVGMYIDYVNGPKDEPNPSQQKSRYKMSKKSSQMVVIAVANFIVGDCVILIDDWNTTQFQ